MAGSRYDRTTNIKRSNIHEDSPACLLMLPDLLFVISLAMALMDGIAKERKTWSQ